MIENNTKISQNIPLETILNNFADATEREIESYDVARVMHRPLSTVMKLVLHYPNSEVEHVYFKAYHEHKIKNNHVRNEFETANFWYNRTKDSNRFHVIHPLYFDDRYQVIISEECKGQSLELYLQKHGQFFPGKRSRKRMMEMTRNTGEWLRYFQSTAPGAKDKTLSLDSLIRYINIRIDGLINNPKIRFTEQLRRQIHRYLEILWQDVEDEKKALHFVHSDLSLSNVMIYKDTVTVLDFPRQKTGSFYKDVTRFYHQLSLLQYKPTFRNRFIEHLKESFLRGYADEQVKHHPLFKIYYIIHHITHLGKNARFWEYSKKENIYNRWLVRKSLAHLKEKLKYEHIR